jgi:hypothetical protein
MKLENKFLPNVPPCKIGFRLLSRSTLQNLPEPRANSYLRFGVH